MKILLIEDEDALRELTVRALSKEGYVVEEASTYDEAWDKPDHRHLAGLENR